MEILISNDQDLPVDVDMLEKIAEYALRHEGVGENAELSIALVDEEEIHQLNLRYRGKDRPTDVLSFQSEVPSEDENITSEVINEIPILLGDVVICPSIAKRQAEEYAQTFEEEMALLLVHGILHLLGYDHQVEGEAEEMEERERNILAAFFEKQKE